MRKSHKPRLSGYTEHQIINHYTTHKYLTTINFTNFNSIATINVITIQCNALTNQHEINHIFSRILTTTKCYVPMKLNCHYKINNYLRKQMPTQYLFYHHHPNNEPTNKSLHKECHSYNNILCEFS